MGFGHHGAWLHVQPLPLTGDEPLPFHTGQRQLVPLVSAAVNRVISLEKLRWISSGHLEADECGAMNLFLDAAPDVEVIQGPLACTLSLIDMCGRPPAAAYVEPGAVHDIGGHRLRFIPTPHVPHDWEAGLWFDETTSNLLAGDLSTAPANARHSSNPIVWHWHWMRKRCSMAPG